MEGKERNHLESDLFSDGVGQEDSGRVCPRGGGPAAEEAPGGLRPDSSRRSPVCRELDSTIVRVMEACYKSRTREGGSNFWRDRALDHYKISVHLVLDKCNETWRRCTSFYHYL